MNRTLLTRCGMILAGACLLAGGWWSFQSHVKPPRLVGAWVRIPNPDPPPGAHVPPPILDDRLVFDASTCVWQRGSEQISQPYTVTVEESQSLLVMDINQDGTLDRVALQGQPRAEVDPFFTISFGHSYGRWSKR